MKAVHQRCPEKNLKPEKIQLLNFKTSKFGKSILNICIAMQSNAQHLWGAKGKLCRQSDSVFLALLPLGIR